MNTRGTDFWDQPAGPPIAPEHFNDIVATAADLAIVLDTSGLVRSVITNPLNPSLGRLDHWKDRDIREFMAEDSLGKLEAQLEAYRGGTKNTVEAIEVNHHDNASWEFPIRYTLHKTGRDDIILMLGRDLRPIAELQHRLVKAQLALEKDYETHRDYETRYRVIMEAARDALILVDVNSGRITDLNSAAAQALGSAADSLTGTAFALEFEGKRRVGFIETLISRAGDGLGGSLAVTTKRLQQNPFRFIHRSSAQRATICCCVGSRWMAHPRFWPQNWPRRCRCCIKMARMQLSLPTITA